MQTPWYYPHQQWQFFTKEAIINIHDKILLRTGVGLSGVKSHGQLESIADKPRTTAFGQDLYPTFFYKVAAQMYEMTQQHAFNDANKRTAVSVAMLTLQLNGQINPATTRPSDDVITTAVLLTATGHLSIDGIRITLLHWCGHNVADTSL